MHSFRVDEDLEATLDFSPIDDLLAAGWAGFRIYEIFHVDDLVHYVDVRVESHRPDRYNWWPRGCQALEGTSRLSAPVLNAWFLTSVPTDILDTAYSEAAERWSLLEAVRVHLRNPPDELTRHEMHLIETGCHPNDQLLATADSANAPQRHFRWRLVHRYSAAEYALFSDLLAHPGIHGFALRGTADPVVLRLACREQFRRCGNDFPLSAAKEFPIVVLGLQGGQGYDPDSGHLISLDAWPAWTCRVRWQFEGLRPTGLFFDEGGYGGSTHTAMDHAEADYVIDAILTTSPDPSPRRAWFHHADGLSLGLGRGSLGHWSDLLTRHGMRPVEGTS